MKDSKNKLKKSSSESKILETKTVPPMPKDKRTKEYKEWYKKYGEIDKKEKRSTPKKNQTKKEESKIDKSLKLKDLVILFITKVDSDDWLSDRKLIEEIKKKIELALKDEFDKEKKKFDKNKKGDEKFIYRSDSKILFQKSLKTFSSKKRKYYSEIGTIQKQNLEKRLELIEKIKDLLNAEKQPNNLYQTFKKFKEEWHNIGQVPITERNNIWETYRHNVKKFYDFLHLNRELKELDFKHNYDEKLKIINKAEALDKVENTMQASRDLNALHKLWKNELGPVSKEFREELWTRFQKASNKIHSKRQKLQKEISSIQNENSSEKEKVLLKMKESSENVPNSHNEWQNSIQLFNKLKDDFQKIRNIPKKKNRVFWNNFRIITKEFNNKKNSFYKNQKIELKKNIDIKKNLIEEVNKILKQENYTQNSKRVIEIQNEWKKVGYIPKKISSSLWNEFRPLCNEFFNNLKSKSKTSNQERTAIKKDKEKQSLKRKISELQNESNQFENNLEYFTNSSSDNPLFKDVSSKITSINDEIEVLKKKLSKITKTEKAEVAKLATTEAETSNETETLNDGES